MPFYRVELHSHCQGDPVDSYLNHSIYEQIDRAKEVGLDAIAITWHRRVCVDPKAEAYARDRGLLLISGTEAEIQRRHLVVLNVAEGDLPPETTWDDIRALRRRKPDVFVLAPHPFYPHPSCLGRRLRGNADCIDAVEWCILHLDWLPGRMNPNLRAARWAHQHGKPLVASSDAHSLEVIGRNASTVEADELTPAAIFRAIRAGRVAFPRRGLKIAPMIYHTGAAIFAQERHVRRWVTARLAPRNGRS
ncbi:MAG: PHP-associated domain-containing protein [Bryobacteraceae bacterium]